MCIVYGIKPTVAFGLLLQNDQLAWLATEVPIIGNWFLRQALQACSFLNRLAKDCQSWEQQSLSAVFLSNMAFMKSC
jgi:hypothetical protein